MSILKNEVIGVSFKITWKIHMMCFFLSGIISIIFYEPINVIIINMLNSWAVIYPTKNKIINLYIFLFILMATISIFHELIHGVTYKLFGGKVKYGFKGIYAYTQEISALPISRSRFLIILFAPVIVISVLACIFDREIGGIIYFLNLLGSTGDILMSFTLIKCNYKSKIVDRSYGYEVI